MRTQGAAIPLCLFKLGPGMLPPPSLPPPHLWPQTKTAPLPQWHYCEPWLPICCSREQAGGAQVLGGGDGNQGGLAAPGYSAVDTVQGLSHPRYHQGQNDSRDRTPRIIETTFLGFFSQGVLSLSSHSPLPPSHTPAPHTVLFHHCLQNTEASGLCWAAAASGP